MFPRHWFFSAVGTAIAVSAGLAVGHAQAQPNPSSMGPCMMGPCMMGPQAVFMRRHMAFMHGGAAPAYANLANPLQSSSAVLKRGSDLYAANCESCHGPGGLGDGQAGKSLIPPPANIAAAARMPMPDNFFFWTISEGGQPFGTAMPAFRAVLSPDDIWSIIAYLRAGLPNQGQTTPQTR